MTFGIGLGGFVQGLTAGINAREAMDERKRRKVIEQRQDEEYDRAKKQRDEVDAIGIQTKKDFDAQVAAGTKKADQFDTFWREQALPKLKETYLTQGNFEAADRLQTWGENADVKAGAKLSMSAMYKASMGDTAGALDDAIKAGQVKGYMDHGYELVDKTEIVDPKTKQTVGYRLNVKTPDGKTVEQDIASADIPRLVSTLTNPEAVWKSYEAAQAQKAADARELKNYEEKKKIDKAYGGNTKARPDAIESLRKRFNGIDGDQVKFDDMPRDQQEKLINDEMSLQAGAPVAPTPGIGIGAGAPSAAAQGLPPQKVIVDKVTGQQVNPAAVPGLSAPARPATAASPAAVPAQQPAPQNETPQVRAQYLIQSAQDAISHGERPSRIADQLKQNGISEDMWPENLNAALQKEQQDSPLGVFSR